MAINHDFLVLCAIRYTIGRQSYAVADGVEWAREYGRSSLFVRRNIIRDLEEAVAQVECGVAALGSEEDARTWRQVLDELRALPA